MTNAGIIYVVGTPIGNLGDFPPRAQTVLAGVDLVLAEDTRHSRKLLDHFQLHPKLQPLHEHNERDLVPRLIARLQAGESMALISDAGMPLVSDPGYILLHAAREAQVPVRVVPGPSAVLAALAASGLPTDRFCFEGFLPPKSGARRERLQALAAEHRTQIYFESPRRILDTLQDVVDCFGVARPASLSRELTKIHEDTLRGSVGEILARLREDPDNCRGEMVLVLGGAPAPQDEPELAPVLLPLLAALPLSQAVALAVQITGLPRKQVYAEALRVKED